MVGTSAWYAGGPGSTSDHGRRGIHLVLKPGFQLWGLYIPCESENHVNVGHVTIWDINEPPMMTNTLSVTTLSANLESSAWRKCYEKD